MSLPLYSCLWWNDLGVTSSLTFANVGSFAINPSTEQPPPPTDGVSGEVVGMSGGGPAVEGTSAVVEEEEHAYEAIKEDDYPTPQQHQWKKSPQRQFRGQDSTRTHDICIAQEKHRCTH